MYKFDPKLLIDLTPEECNILSFIASYAHVRTEDSIFISLKVANASTKRCIKIAEIMLDKIQSSNKKYKFMSSRFLFSAGQNRKGMTILNRQYKCKCKCKCKYEI